MLILKVIFWIFVFDTIAKFILSLVDHPRERKPATIELDFMSFLFSLGFTIWIGITLFS